MESIIIYKSKKKAFILMACSLLIALCGYSLLQYGDKEVISWSLIILSFFMLFLGIGTLFDRNPQIIFTTRGITETSTIRQEIEWDAIRGIDEFYYLGQYFIRILVDRDYKPGLLSPTWFYRYDRMYAKEGVKALFIRVSLLETNSIRLSQMMQRMIKTDNRQQELKTMQ